MALDSQRAAQQRMRLAVLVLTGVVLLLVGVVVGMAAGGGSESDPSPAATGTPTNDGVGGDSGDGRDQGPGFKPTETIQPPDEYTAPDEWVHLPAGTGESDSGLPVGFPQTAEGATAMVVASTRNSWTWDPDQVEDGVLTYVNTAEQNDLLSVVDDSVRGMREYVGIPQTGPVPDGAALNATPIGVQWEELDDGTVRVSTQVRVTSTSGEGEDTRTNLHSTVNDAVWEQGDWKVRSVPSEVVQDAPDAAELGSPEFNSAGWIAIQEGDVR
jgi:hypothetical protein